jgi:hypothetical protein
LTVKRQNSGHGSGGVSALEASWEAIRAQHPDVPPAVVVIGAGSSSQRLRLGHFAASRWQTDNDALAEIFVGGEGLARGASPVLATLLHEAAHAIAHHRQIRDTSRQGGYHNQRFKALAEQLGLQIDHHPTLGWSPTTITNTTVVRYAAALDQLEAALSTHRQPEAHSRKRPGDANLLVCVCGCGRRIRVAGGVLELAPIICSSCQQPFNASITSAKG